MAHFAEINADGIVINVVVVNNDVIDQNNEEQSGLEFLSRLYGADKTFKQTSYNHKFRKQYAGIGYRYDSEADVFIAPSPFPSWVLDANYNWQAPIPTPGNVSDYLWDEDNQAWIPFTAWQNPPEQ